MLGKLDEWVRLMDKDDSLVYFEYRDAHDTKVTKEVYQNARYFVGAGDSDFKWDNYNTLILETNYKNHVKTVKRRILTTIHKKIEYKLRSRNNTQKRLRKGIKDGVVLRLNNLITKTKLEVDDLDVDYHLHLESDSSASESDLGQVEIVPTKDASNVWGFV